MYLAVTPGYKPSDKKDEGEGRTGETNYGAAELERQDSDTRYGKPQL